jgi:hypothetical protein
MNNIQKLKISDLRSLYDLKNWVREHAEIFHGKNIDKENMLIILNYLKEAIKKSDASDKSGWLDTIIELEHRAEAIESEPEEL